MANDQMMAKIRDANGFTRDIGGGGRRRFIWVPEMWANV
jgi:hypothetical protein